MGTIIEASGLVNVEFHHEGKVTRARVGYRAHSTRKGRRLNLKDVNLRDPYLLAALEDPQLHARILGLIVGQDTEKLRRIIVEVE